METTGIRPGLNYPALRADDSYLINACKTGFGDQIAVRNIDGWVDTDFQHVRFTPSIGTTKVTYLAAVPGMTLEVTRPQPDMLAVNMMDERGVIASMEVPGILVVHSKEVASQVRDWYEGEDA